MKPFILSCLMLGASALAAQATTYLDPSGWSWSASSTCSTEGSLDAIHDGDVDTYWHSDYNATDANRYCPHWVQIDRQSDTKEFTALTYMPRYTSSTNTYVTKYRIYLSDVSFGNLSTVDESVLGTADYSGEWDATYEEKVAQLTKSSTARYILFVIDSTVSTRSAACAELRLCSSYDGSSSSTNTGNTGNTSTTTDGKYNAVKITTTAADSRVDYIAISNNTLSISLASANVVALINAGISIQYEVSEVATYTFANYTFSTNAYYEGPKKDGEVIEPEPEPEPGTDQSGINETAVSAIGFSYENHVLTLCGLSPADQVTLYNASGVIIANPGVDAQGSVSISTESMAHGVYVLRAANKSFKITI